MQRANECPKPQCTGVNLEHLEPILSRKEENGGWGDGIEKKLSKFYSAKKHMLQEDEIMLLAT